MAYFVIPSLRGIFVKSKQNRLLAKIPRRLGMTKKGDCYTDNASPNNLSGQSDGSGLGVRKVKGKAVHFLTKLTFTAV